MRPIVLCLLLALGVAGCPKLPPVSGCTPSAWRCSPDGRPEVCSASQRWEPAGERSCASVGAVCVVERTAHCAARDAGTDASEVAP